MKKIYLSIILFLFVLSVSAQVPILYYDFEDSYHSSFQNAVELQINSGSGALSKVGGTTTISSGSGAGSFNGGSSSGKAIQTQDYPTSSSNPGTSATKYLQFVVNTSGFTGMSVNFDAYTPYGSYGTPNITHIGVLYSTNGTTFAAASTTPQLFATYGNWDNFSFSLPSAADNKTSVTIRIYAYDANGSSDYYRMDNLMVSATGMTSSATMLDASAIGKDMRSGSSYTPTWGSFSITGNGTVCTPTNDMKFSSAVSVGSGATLDLEGNTISGSGSFTLNSGAALTIGDGSGITSSGSSGNIQVSGTRTYNAGATYDYVGSFWQYTGNGLPSTITGSLIIECSFTILSSDVTIGNGGNVELKSGWLSAGNNLTFASGSTLTRSGGTISVSLLSAATNIVYTGSSKTVGNELFSTLTNINVNLNSGQTLTLSGNNTINGSITLTSGILDMGTTTQTITGSIVRDGSSQTGTLDVTSASLIFSGTSAQSIDAGALVSNTVNNLTLNNASGLKINGNTTVSNALTLTSGSLDLNGKTLTLSGTVSGSGKLKGSATSGLLINSTGTVGTLNFDQTTDGSTNALDSLKINGTGGTTTLGNKLNVYNSLNIAAGTLNLNAQNLVLKSLSTGTAYVSPVTGTLSGATNVTVERYIPNDGRRYRIITPGVTTTSSIKANWMEGGMNTSISVNSNPKPGYGTQITGSGGNANGFDVTQTNSASLYTYNATTQQWVAVTNTNATLVANQPYLIFIRGDRSVDLTSQAATLPSTATTLRATGTLMTGDFTSSALVGNGAFNLLGNPFSGAVDWTAISADANNTGKFQASYTYWDPKIGTRGSYVTVDNTGTKSNGSARATTAIQTGMGFFVQVKTGVSNPTLSVKQNHKSGSGKNGDDVFRVASQMERLNTSLFFYDASNTRLNADGVTTVFDNSFSKDVDDNDAVEIPNWDEDIALVRGGKSLSIEKRPEITGKDTLFIGVARLKQQAYEWQFDPANFTTAGLEAVLVDKFTSTQKPIRLDQPTVISFSVTSDPASSAADRFYITFRTASVLPITLVSFSGQRINNDDNLSWTSATEINFDHYDVEYSTDQFSYVKLDAIQGRGTSAGTASYTYIHKNAISPNNYYRLKMVDKDGSFTYSNIVFLKGNDADGVYHIYPNPSIGGKFNIDFSDQSYKQIDIYDFMGRKVKTAETTSNHFVVDKLLPGIYSIDITNSDGQLLHSEKVVVK